MELAFKFHQEGRLADAERLYREVLQKKPRDFEALHMLGILKLQQNQPGDAVGLIAAAIAVDRTSVAAHSNYGLALGALGRHDEALASFDKALAINPRNADTVRNRADTLYDLGRIEEALAGYDKALEIDPRHVGALVNRGLLLRDLGRTAEALASYDKALAADSRDVEAWNNRGVALADLDRHVEALACYDRALALWPDYGDALYNRANALNALKRPADALAAFARVLVMKPDLAEAYNGRGHALFDLGRFEEAMPNYDKAIALKPEFFDARIGRARTLEKLDRHEEAAAEYEKLGEAVGDGFSDILMSRMTTCNWLGVAGMLDELATRLAAGASLIDPFMLLGLPSTPEQQLACAKTYLRLKKFTGVKQEWDPAQFAGDRIRVAYLSADFNRHATAILIAELFELHDRRNFEIIGISFGADDGSPQRSRIIKSFDRFFDVTTRSAHDVGKLVRDLKVHIAVDLKGFTTDHRMGIMAQRIAPIQVDYLGYPATTGADFIDYVIADPISLPFDDQPFFTEKIVHLPDTYQVNDSTRPIAAETPTRAAAGLPADGFVFCCFNNSWKLNAPMFDIWMRLLAQVEGSVLWLFKANSFACENLRREARARGIDPARLVFAPRCQLSEHLARHRLADLFIDTLPYNAHTTASDALWAGLPLLTCKGSTFAGRVAASVLHAVGLPELVAETLDDYERMALALARDPALLASLRSRLAEHRLASPLFDSKRFCRHIEAAYKTMWHTWLRGKPPASFSVDSRE